MKVSLDRFGSIRSFCLSLFAITILMGGVANAAPQCSDGLDNDNDGGVDALYAPDPASAAPRSWHKDPFGLVGFVNSKAAEYGFRPIGDGSALNFDATTAQFVCRLAGYSGVASMDCVSVYDGGRCGWYSPSDNRLDNWDPSINNFRTRNARDAGNRWLTTLTCINKIPKCSDGKDNDGDGKTDFPADPGCANAWDEDERPHDVNCTGPNDNSEFSQCNDGIDNDGDGAVDGQDFSCSSAFDDDETNPKSQCQDGIDNDGDGVVDLADPGCSNKQDNSENSATTQCQDGIDNDGDGAADYPNDFSCSSRTDNDETNPKSQCQDGVDNDGDGVIDLADPGCSGTQDNSESSATTQCQDGADNDGDGLIDSSDPGCSNPQDNNESDGTSQCQDGADNDGDGLVDFGNDPGCDSPGDNSESDQLSKLIPFVECVDKIADSSYVAHYSYLNDTGATVNLPVGALNGFTPAPADRSQPTVFLGGLFADTFTVPFDGTPLTWQLGTNTAVASSSTPLCPEEAQQPNCKDSDITALLIALDSGARQQQKLVQQAAKQLIKLNASERSYAARTKKQSMAVYKQAWSTTWTLPRLVTTCENNTQCVSTSNVPTLSEYRRHSDELRVLAEEIAKRIGAIKTKKAKKQAAAIKKKAQSLSDANERNAELVPKASDQC
ncbi:MAG: hypothetical protein J5J00_02905 [Deltaproteobacteria bacterium]|nr:hypothetical protein [Deltaproteobacteria bacterium]